MTRQRVNKLFVYTPAKFDILSTMPLNTEKIEALRVKKGWTQEEAARAAGLSGRQHWNNIVSGKQSGITLATLEKIAQALGCRAKDLLK